MAVRIRLKRFGRKKKPVYRLVVADKASPRDGRVIEEIGFYDPRVKPKVFDFKKDKVEYWLGLGAEPSEPVLRLFGEAGILPKVKRISKNPGLSKKDEKAQEETSK